jgi:hypothetical protein
MNGSSKNGFKERTAKSDSAEKRNCWGIGLILAVRAQAWRYGLCLVLKRVDKVFRFPYGMRVSLHFCFVYSIYLIILIYGVLSKDICRVIFSR